MAASIDDTPSVLLVDDRPENLLALAAVLEPLQVRLRTAGSGEEALKALLEEDFAVVLLDVQMPGMDGFETAKFIRGRERSRTTPIIFLTAVSTDIAQVARGYQAGAVDYVLKPFEPNMLRSKVSVFCDLERQRRARARADEMLLLAWRSLPTGAALDRRRRAPAARQSRCCRSSPRVVRSTAWPSARWSSRTIAWRSTRC